MKGFSLHVKPVDSYKHLDHQHHCSDSNVQTGVVVVHEFYLKSTVFPVRFDERVWTEIRGQIIRGYIIYRIRDFVMSVYSCRETTKAYKICSRSHVTWRVHLKYVV